MVDNSLYNSLAITTTRDGIFSADKPALASFWFILTVTLGLLRELQAVKCNAISAHTAVYRVRSFSDSINLRINKLVICFADNQEKLILYGMLCGCLAFICALIVFIARMFYVRYKKAKRSNTHQKLNVTEPAIQVSQTSQHCDRLRFYNLINIAHDK